MKKDPSWRITIISNFGIRDYFFTKIEEKVVCCAQCDRLANVNRVIYRVSSCVNTNSHELKLKEVAVGPLCGSCKLTKWQNICHGIYLRLIRLCLFIYGSFNYVEVCKKCLQLSYIERCTGKRMVCDRYKYVPFTKRFWGQRLKTRSTPCTCEKV